MTFLLNAKNRPKKIIDMVKLMEINLRQRFVPDPMPEQVPSREAVAVMIEKILSHENKIEENGDLIISLYDDLLEELPNAGMREFM